MKKSFISALALAASLGFAGSAWAEVIFAVGAPLTGPNAAFGAQLQKGAEKAVADINAAGGMNGEQIKLVFGDDVSDPKQGVSVANKFVADGVSVVIGHFNSGVSIPASEVYAENGILQVSPAATNPVYTDRGMWNTFRTCGRDDQQGDIAGAYIAENFKDAKIAVVHDKTPYGQGLADLTKAAMNEEVPDPHHRPDGHRFGGLGCRRDRHVVGWRLYDQPGRSLSKALYRSDRYQRDLG
jgi:branched-chain amino acid transport system substrate-binding protein